MLLCVSFVKKNISKITLRLLYIKTVYRCLVCCRRPLKQSTKNTCFSFIVFQDVCHSGVKALQVCLQLADGFQFAVDWDGPHVVEELQFPLPDPHHPGLPLISLDARKKVRAFMTTVGQVTGPHDRRRGWWWQDRWLRPFLQLGRRLCDHTRMRDWECESRILDLNFNSINLNSNSNQSQGAITTMQNTQVEFKVWRVSAFSWTTIIVKQRTPLSSIHPHRPHHHPSALDQHSPPLAPTSSHLRPWHLRLRAELTAMFSLPYAKQDILIRRRLVLHLSLLKCDNSQSHILTA